MWAFHDSAGMRACEVDCDEHWPWKDRRAPETRYCESIYAFRLDTTLILWQIKNGAKPSFSNSCKLYQLVDELPRGSEWIRETFEVKGDKRTPDGKDFMKEELEIWMRNPVELVKELMSNPSFQDVLVYAPEKRFMDST